MGDFPKTFYRTPLVAASVDPQENFAYFVKSKHVVITFSFKCVIPSREKRCFIFKIKVR